ncbi:2'-5' RNA ligase family protein [Lapidilactobacillus wuchangensis]|uniref:2'-5' RNA ligase family protein n=1 Tax=Lapidilactobacillus wuchangensis TaxID=2486001 RepID=UPI0013DE44D2|nr:2'-5' RNA ligase family protein [Lapidilactobacillus wuchangensis]
MYWQLTTGCQAIQRLHDQLYAGTLASYEQKQYPYQPHLTLGHLSSSAGATLNKTAVINQLNQQLQPETVLVDRITIEAIQPDESSQVIAEFNLK